jgi:acyl-coenzyme A synthetase/AMP-(fatty) acid ligase
LGLFFSVILSVTGSGGSIFLLILLMLALVIGGLSAVPLRGSFMAQAHAKRIETVRRAYLAQLSKAAADQVAFGRQMRLDAVAPFLRMVESQLVQADAVKAELAAHGNTLTALEAELGKLR